MFWTQEEKAMCFVNPSVLGVESILFHYIKVVGTYNEIPRLSKMHYTNACHQSIHFSPTGTGKEGALKLLDYLELGYIPT